MLSVSTSRLDLIAATIDLLEAELHDRARLSLLLNAAIPDNWPPPLNDIASMEWMLRYLQHNSDSNGWSMWYFVLRDGPGGRPLAIGNGGFKGKPSADGTVEVGYSIMENNQRQGYASEAVNALLGWAFMHPGITRIVAETLPDLTPSIRLLDKLGFRLVGKGSEEGVIRYGLLRGSYEQDTSF